MDFLGGIDCLVNNAGISFNCPFLKIQPKDLDTLFDVNFRTPFLLTQRLAEPMLKQGSGAICNLASIHALQGAPEHSAYAATKGAIMACTRLLPSNSAIEASVSMPLLPGGSLSRATPPLSPASTSSRPPRKRKTKYPSRAMEFLSTSPNSPHSYVPKTPGTLPGRLS